MGRRRKRGLSYLPPAPSRTPFLIYVVLAAVLLVALYQVKKDMVKSVNGEVVDAYTGQPIVDANVTLKNDATLAHTAGIEPETTVKTDMEGRFNFGKAAEKYSLRVEALNYRVPPQTDYDQIFKAQIRLTPGIIKGIVKDDAGNPMPRATVSIGERTTITGSEGDFQFYDAPESGKIIVKATGFWRSITPFEKTARQDVKMTSFRAKGVYVPAVNAANEDFMPNLLNLITTTELNTVVIDLKDESGRIAFNSKQALAKSMTEGKGLISDLPGLTEKLHSRNIYAIARFSVFLDPILTDEKPEWSLKSKSSPNRLWADTANYNWSNPYSQDVWNYNIGLAKEAAEAGFDEIQFDYLRFPALGNLADISYDKDNIASNRMAAVAGFLKRAHEVLNPYGTYISMNIFGLSTLQTDDLEVGTKLEALADQVDYLSPTLYPSSWGKGTFGYDQPASKPYDVVRNVLINAKPFFQGRSAMLRPWLQDFSLEPVRYGSKEVRDQIRAADESDSGTAGGWMLWNSQARYTAGALNPKPENEVRNNATSPKR